MGHQDGVLDFGVAVHAHVRRNDGVRDPPAGYDRAHGDNGIDGDAHAPPFLRKDELGWRVLALVGADGPVAVIEVEDGRYGHQVHVGLVVGLDRPDVAPVFGFLPVLVDEVVGKDPVTFDELGDNVPAEVVSGTGVFGVLHEHVNQEVVVEAVDAHGDVRFVGVVRRGLGVGRLFLPADDAAVGIKLEHAEPRRFRAVEFDRADGDFGTGGHVLVDHQLVVHLVHVVARKDQDVLGRLAANRIEVLVNRVRRCAVPVLSHAHHGRQDLNEFAEFARQDAPAFADVPVERKGLVLRQDKDPAQAGVDAVREREVNDAVNPAEGHGGFGPVASQRVETLARTAGQQAYQCVLRVMEHGVGSSF